MQLTKGCQRYVRACYRALQLMPMCASSLSMKLRSIQKFALWHNGRTCSQAYGQIVFACEVGLLGATVRTHDAVLGLECGQGGYRLHEGAADGLYAGPAGPHQMEHVHALYGGIVEWAC